jgi:mRNA interferase MazF
MARFIKGDIVVIPFPFSDLSASKKRPAFVLADLPGDDILLCQITSQLKKDKFAIALENKDFKTGGLPVNSFIHPTRIFTAYKKIIIRKAGTTSSAIIQETIRQLIILLSK